MKEMGARELSRWLRVLSALPEDLSPVFSTNIVQNGEDLFPIACQSSISEEGLPCAVIILRPRLKQLSLPGILLISVGEGRTAPSHHHYLRARAGACFESWGRVELVKYLPCKCEDIQSLGPKSWTWARGMAEWIKHMPHKACLNRCKTLHNSLRMWLQCS